MIEHSGKDGKKKKKKKKRVMQRRSGVGGTPYFYILYLVMYSEEPITHRRVGRTE